MMGRPVDLFFMFPGRLSQLPSLNHPNRPWGQGLHLQSSLHGQQQSRQACAFRPGTLGDPLADRALALVHDIDLHVFAEPAGTPTKQHLQDLSDRKSM